jgi:hypothetical protein
MVHKNRLTQFLLLCFPVKRTNQRAEAALAAVAWKARRIRKRSGSNFAVSTYGCFCIQPQIR